MPVRQPTDFSTRKGWKISAGDLSLRPVKEVKGYPVINAVMLATLGLKPGDTVEITYGADEIVIRRAGETKREVVTVGRGWNADGEQTMYHPSGRGRAAALRGAGWWLYSPSRLATVRSGCTESQAIAWCLDGVLPTDGGEG